MSYNFVPDTVVSFKVYPSAILGDVFQNATVLGVINARSAIAFGYPIAERHAQVAPYVSGIPTQATQYSYLQLQLADGSMTFVGLPWIKEDTIEVVGQQTAYITLPNVKASDGPAILAALESNNFHNASVSFSSTVDYTTPSA